MINRPILERIESWYWYAGHMGIPLTRILVHPDDFTAAPTSHEGLPVVSMSPSPGWGRRQGQGRVNPTKHEAG